MLIRETTEVFRYKIEQAVGKDASGRQVLDYVFGETLAQRGNAPFVIREWRTDRRTRLQRLNMFWAMPLTLLCAPYQYVVHGFIGWDTKTRLGRWILRATGHFQEAA